MEEYEKMTLNRLPGIYFGETVETAAAVSTIKPLYIIQTSATLTALDDKITLFTDVDDLDTALTGKTGVAQQLKYIKQSVAEDYNSAAFYVYSIKTDTKAAFKQVLLDLIDYEDIQEVFYYEEAKSENANTIIKKMEGLQEGVNACAQRGVFRRAYVTPYGTVNDAVSNAENTTNEAAAITSLTTILSGFSDGRLYCILPDEFAGVVSGRINQADYDEEIGYSELNTSITELTYNFSYDQMVTLQNLGVIFIRKVTRRGVASYRINMGVSTSFSSELRKADSLLFARRIADQVLRSCKRVLEGYVLSKQTENSMIDMQTDVLDILDEYIEYKDILSEGTSLEVVDTPGAWTVGLEGTIQPVGCMAVIEVNTVLGQED